MNFRVKLNKGPPVTVEADKFVIKDGVYLFSTDAAGPVASFPVSNLLSVVKEDQPEGGKTGK